MSANSLSIRNAHETDVTKLIELYLDLSAENGSLSVERGVEILSRLQSYDGSNVLIGEVGEEIATSCTLIVIPNLTYGGRPYALIENVVTLRKFRKRGFGKQILLAASDAAWRSGCYKIMLLTGSRNTDTLKFYSEAGFEQTKTGHQKRRIATREE